MTHIDVSERDFETTIVDALVGGATGVGDGRGTLREAAVPYAAATLGSYRQRSPAQYDRALCLDPDTVVDFIVATQPKAWARLAQHHGADVKARFLKRLAAEVAARGTVDVLRRGVKDSGCTFQLAYVRPSSGLNPALQTLYLANQFTVIRQVRYAQRTEHSLDLVLFLNGLPLFTVELKDPLTGQDVRDAMRQYAEDRDPREPLFAFGRCLAHVALDTDLAYVTTRLDGPKTRFLPFNLGRNGGAGNPPSWRGYATAYLWEEIWAPDSILNLVQHFVHVVEEEDDRGRKTGQRHLIFPRYHQLDAVRRLVADARQHGTGRRYLIQHSAGSGKSNSIAWLAHQLSILHDEHDERVFDSIVVITDRRVLDRQLQGTVRQFQQTLGVVATIEGTSQELKEALEQGKTIVVTTLQKFPVIANAVTTLPGKRFAVIVDEAHSSQSGESTRSVHKVLAAGSLDEAEREDAADAADDLEDRIVAELRARGQIPNVSTFAFTATPKGKTLELFGTRRPDGSYVPFSLYSMRQAIEEGFILDVLANYTTYRTYWSLLKKIEADPRYDRTKATGLLRSFVDLHPRTIERKVAIMVDHFVAEVAHRVGGKAKAMIVTRSRLHAVRYKQAIDAYLKERGHAFKALVAFSGTVRDGGLEYTEASMNGFPDTQTAETYKLDEHRFLVVANKFQTGFDQPLLHTMYVDKKLGGVNAVQTLSRLNRVHPEKDGTLVLDFANDADEIQEAFEPYYERTILSEGTDPNLLYDLQTRLSTFHLVEWADVERYAALYFAPRGAANQARLHAALAPTVGRYADADEEERAEFRSQLTDFVRLYAFLSQLITFEDVDLEKLYVFARHLLRKLPIPREELPLEVQQSIDVESYRIQRTSSGSIKLARGNSTVDPIGSTPTPLLTAEQLEALSQIIEELNRRFGTEFTEDDKVFIRQLEEKLAGSAALEASVKVNPPDHARLTFDLLVNDEIQDMVETNFKFYKQITDDRDFARVFLDWLFDRYVGRVAR